MRRRAFLGVLGSVAAWPMVGRAQQGKPPVIAVLSSATPAAWKPWTARFVQRLAELGWVEGRTITIEYRWTAGRIDGFAAVAADLIRLKPAVIVTTGTAVPALKRATSAIPIVFAIGRDPVGEGLVQSLARPGGNVTGLSTQVPDLAGKRLELLREILPGLRKLAVLFETVDPAALRERSEVSVAARTLGLAVVNIDIQRPEDDFASALQSLKGRADALYCGAGAITSILRSRIFAQALATHLPSISGLRLHAQAGALVSYGPDYADLFGRAGDYVDKILRGAKAANIPVEQPTKFELIVNLKTAKALGLNIPSAFLLRADEVIE